MKKILYILFAMTFIFASCTDEIDFLDDTQSKDCITLTVFNGPMTKAAGDDKFAYESHLTRLDVFFYVEGQTDQNCVYYQEVLDPDNNYDGGKIPFYVVEDQINMIFPEGNETCDVFVIANLPDDMRTFDTNPEGGYTNTEFNRLTSILLNLEDGDYDAIGKDFIMAGFDGNVRRDISTNNAEGTVKLIRAASKITITVNIPAKITLEEGPDSVTMVPVLEAKNINGETIVPILSSLHNAVKQGYVYPAGMTDSDVQASYFETQESSYIWVQDIDVDGTPGVEKYQYKCEVPFYSYPSLWPKGDEHAAHFSLEIPWMREGEQTYHPYYYQILINAANCRLDPNHWYDMTVNVGVIGSSVKLTPVELKDLTFYVLDWTTQPDPEDEAGGDRYEDLEMKEYIYFSVPEKRVEMNNNTVGELRYEASHNIAWELEWPTGSGAAELIATFDDLEKEYNDQNGKRFYAYYINCRPSSGTTPTAVSLQSTTFIDKGDFSAQDSIKTLIFNYPKNNINNTYKVYSPVYVHLKVWLDINGDEAITTDLHEDDFIEYVTFVYYPAMYIVPELSVTESVYVNGDRATTNSHNVIYVNGRTYDLGGAYGQDNSKYMHTINVSSFTDNDKFTLDGQPVSYIIGDPRVRKSNLNLNDDGYDMTLNNTKGNGWVLDAAGEELEYYYPTSTDPEVARVISPKFRISSKLGGYSEGDREGTTMRCASYQEKGYPAGRWRVPTTAEIAFIVYLQSQDVIQDLFVNNDYFSSTHLVTEVNNGVQISEIDTDDHSVRCVYDEWFWGSEKEAIIKNGANETQGDYYLFTWGDRQIWPE